MALLCLAAAPTDAAELTNGGFEGSYTAVTGRGVAGAAAPGWSDNSSWADVTATYAAAASAHGGRAAQQITARRVAAGEVQFFQPQRLARNTIATLGMWLRGTPGTRVSLRLQRAAPPYDSFADTTLGLTADWQHVVAEGFVTADADALALIGVQSSGVAVIDDATFATRPGRPTPLLPTGPVEASAFGLHLANYLSQRLQNPGFEGAAAEIVPDGRARLSGTLAHGWQDNSSFAPVTVAYATDTDRPHGGRTAQRVDVAAVPQCCAQLVQRLAAGANRTITFSVWLRGRAGDRLDLLLEHAASPYEDFATAPVTLGTEWTRASVTGKVGADGQVAVMLRAYAPLTYWVDDAAVADSRGNPLAGGVPWPDAPFGTLRLWDAGTDWADLEPQKGVWNFAPLDNWVNAAAAHGQPDIVLTLGQSPRWASARPGDATFYGPGAPAEPRDIADWQDYVRTLARRYRGRIRYWEVWNEPNDPTFYTGSVASLVQLTAAAASVLKQVDPANVVLTPAPYSVGYMDRFLAAGGAASADAVAFHIYRTPPELAAPALAALRLSLAAHGLAKPIWVTEGAAGDTTTPDDQGAGLLARSYLIELAYGAERFDWYSWGPATPFCVATSRHPAGTALRVLQSWLVGATLTGLTTDAAGTWTLSLHAADGAPAAILWNPDGTRGATLPGGLRATTRSELTGASRPAGTILAGPSPVLYR